MAMFKIKKLLKRSSKCPGPLVQSLPHSILHRIALYTSAFEQSSIRQWEMASSPEITRPLLSMLSVCKNWRAAVMPIFYHTAKLSISADSTHIEPTDDLTHSLSDVIRSKEYTLPRCVVVTVPYAGVFNGSITNLLSSMGYADAVFPEVTELRFNLYSGYYISDDDSAEYDFYTDCFCGYIHAMFPNAQDYHFRVYPFANADDSEMISNVLAGLTQRGAGARVFEYVHSSNMVDISGFQLLTNLTHITFQTDVDRAEYIKLVTQCADTLESVDLQRVKIASAWADLVQDQWGSPIVYPRLRKLSFCVHESSLFHYLDAPEGTPFPSLTHLSVTGGYPYANDILFRGNHKTLENLSIHLDIPKLFLFEEYGVFAKSRYPNLRSMELTGPSENNYVEKALVLKVARIPFEVSSRMQSVKIKLHGWMRGRTILDAIHLSPHQYTPVRPKNSTEHNQSPLVSLSVASPLMLPSKAFEDHHANTVPSTGSMDLDEFPEDMHPPENFAMVCPYIYRSGMPKKRNYPFLKKLKLKSILTLILEEYPTQNQKFLDQNGIKLFQFGVAGNKEPFADIPEDIMSEALLTLLDKRNHPILIHCNKGKHRTGCLVGCLRKIQEWSNTSIFDEYRRYSAPKSRSMDQQFIELFDIRPVLESLDSEQLPNWPTLR
ncbi:tyrosine-protein phosphatase siw14 [Dipsacomyces acuminosporus]|nr:tyrosine-protein phosphatase siw14 [Dipsacomyces acuminosporus]